MKKNPILHIMLILLLVTGAEAGKLGSFEKAAEKKTKSSKKSKSESESSRSCHHPYNCGCYDYDRHDGFDDLLFAGFVYGGVASWVRATGGYENLSAREIGEPLIPLFRFDVSYENVESDVYAMDYRAELGFGPMAVHFNQTHYKEEDPDDVLDLITVYGVYRMSASDWFEVDLSIGGMNMRGEESKTGWSWSLPMLFYPHENFGMEFRPAWSDVNGNGVSDYDLGLFFRLENACMKVGYRWVYVDSESLNGVYAGFSVRL